MVETMVLRTYGPRTIVLLRLHVSPCDVKEWCIFFGFMNSLVRLWSSYQAFGLADHGINYCLIQVTYHRIPPRKSALLQGYGS